MDLTVLRAVVLVFVLCVTLWQLSAGLFMFRLARCLITVFSGSCL